MTMLITEEMEKVNDSKEKKDILILKMILFNQFSCEI